MELNGLLQSFPGSVKFFIGTFVLVLSVGYFTGLTFVSETGATVPKGIEENYLGNEEDLEAEVMIFKKSEREILTIIHTHILSMSMIFFLLGSLVWIARLPKKLKVFLTIEPLCSVLLTFGGIYFLWKGMLWMKYVVMISGILMTISYGLAALIVFFQLLGKPGKIS